MKILHFASIYHNKASGLSFSIPNLINALNFVKGEKIADLYNTKDGIDIKTINFKTTEIFIFNSFFYTGYLKILLIIPRSKVIIICPRGAFSNSNHYSIIKHLYAFIYFMIIKIRRLNAAIHYLTIDEQRRSRFHLKKEFVIGNTHQLDVFKDANESNIIIEKYKSKQVVYVGRFSNHVKGLDLLFETLNKHIDTIQKNKIQFHFYGPGTKDKIWLENYAKRNNLNFIHFHSEVYGKEKNVIFNNAMFHILTSRSEGFPMSVLESSAFYTPQILSKGTNLHELMKEYNFGICFSDCFIKEIASLSFNEYEIMSNNAKNFALQHNFENIGRKTLHFYETI